MDYKEVLNKEIKKLKRVINQLGDMDIISCNTKNAKINKQGKLNKAYGIILDVKVDLEYIVNEMEETSQDEISTIKREM